MRLNQPVVQGCPQTAATAPNCVFSFEHAMCKTLEKAGVPRDDRWWSLVLYIRSLERHDYLSQRQKSELQSLVVGLLKEKDFSEDSFRQALTRQEEILSLPYKERIRSALQESAEIIRDFKHILRSRVSDVERLEKETMQAISEGLPPEQALHKIRDAFQQLAEHMRRDTEGLEEIASKDSLTGFQNRRAFERFMAEKAARHMERGSVICLIMLDIDHFKRVNDTLGHQAGDQVLTATAAAIATAVGRFEASECLLARYGGEEFCIVLPDSFLEEAVTVAEDIRKAVEAEPVRIVDAQGKQVGETVGVTASLGVAAVKPGWSDRLTERLLEAADMALYEAKNAGRNRVVAFTDEKS